MPPVTALELSLSESPSWRRLIDGAARRLRSEADAWRIAERASGWDRAELTLRLASSPTRRVAEFFARMVDQRSVGQPLQYVLGRWSFRTLELLVDRRVLIPRPETELVVQVALAEARRLRPDWRERGLVAVDVGTGSGAIALSLAAELPEAEVWATEVSPDALAVARANLAGLGSRGTRVRLLEGTWLTPLPDDLRGRVDLIVSNPPYVAAQEVLPAEVADWEPAGALVAGETGLEGIEQVVTAAPAWLATPGSLVVELAPHQADAAVPMARDAGFGDVRVEPDLSGRPRVLVGSACRRG